MSYSEAAAYESQAAKKGVSDVARSSRGFMRAYERNKSPRSLCRESVADYPSQTWGRRRQGFIARHLAQYKTHPTKRRWLALVMWAYKATKLH